MADLLLRALELLAISYQLDEDLGEAPALVRGEVTGELLVLVALLRVGGVALPALHALQDLDCLVFGLPPGLLALQTVGGDVLRLLRPHGP